MRTADSGAPNLRPSRDTLVSGGRALSRRMARLWTSPGLVNSPVLIRLGIGLAFLSAMALGLAITAAAVGPYTIPPSHIMDILIEWVGLGPASASDTERAIVGTIRLPRILLALTVGGALGIAGAVMQGLFRNPMADPGIIGVSTGGALGAVIAIAIGAQAVFPLALPAMSFAGATATLVLVYFVASIGGRFSMAALLLAGVAISAFIAAIISAIILFTSNLQAQREMLFWLAGGFGASTWTDVRIALPIILIGIATAIVLARDLNLLMVGDEEARSLGVRVALTRNTLLLATSLITGAAVAFSGTIAFVGLIAPHTLRLVIGADHRALVPLSGVGGGVFLL
ncbi:MAG: iron chelate uptake ABC transporter family permease subunit, partial [Dehalococcoidia bacterium]|nr:iron chelate uptake ABC transporter family permease subunit [Dehalococcoidia bacterium]